MCVTCETAVLAAAKLRDFVQLSQKIWTNVVSSLNNLPRTISYSMKSLSAFIDPNDMSIQMVKDFAGDPKSILKKLNSMGTKSSVERKPQIHKDDSLYSCPDCGKMFPNTHYLAMHLVNSGQKEACVICGAVIHRGEKMKDHMRSVHNKRMFLCADCPLMFPRGTQLAEHIVKCHKRGANTCVECGRSFPTAITLDHHARMHVVQTCMSCGTRFTNRSCYRRHKSQCIPTVTKLHFPESGNRKAGKYKCDRCGKKYLSQLQLKNHILWIHMDMKPHKCQWCSKQFHSPAGLAKHTLVHTGVSYDCDICGAKLTTKRTAMFHKRSHSGEKPFTCKECGECFVSASRRSDHAKRKHNQV